MRAIPSTIVVPKFNPAGDVMNPAAVLQCIADITDIEREEDLAAAEAAEAAENASQVCACLP